MSISSIYGRLRKWLRSKNFLRWYNNKDVVPTLEAMQKMIAFYHHKGIDMLKLGCTLPNLANICLHKPTKAKFYPFTENDKDLLEMIQDYMFGGPSIVFTRKAVVNETLIQDSANVCKSIVVIDDRQLYPFSMVQEMPTGLYTQWDRDPESGRFKPRKNKTRSFENMVMSYYQRIRPECKIVSFYTTGLQKKIDCFRRVLLTLQHCIRSHGVFLSLLSLSRSASFTYRGGRESEGNEKERDG